MKQPKMPLKFYLFHLAYASNLIAFWLGFILLPIQIPAQRVKAYSQISSKF
jgi:hypothetical protein